MPRAPASPTGRERGGTAALVAGLLTKVVAVEEERIAATPAGGVAVMFSCWMEVLGRSHIECGRVVHTSVPETSSSVAGPSSEGPSYCGGSDDDEASSPSLSSV